MSTSDPQNPNPDQVQQFAPGIAVTLLKGFAILSVLLGIIVAVLNWEEKGSGTGPIYGLMYFGAGLLVAAFLWVISSMAESLAALRRHFTGK